MSIIITFAGASLIKPGSYSRVKPALGGAADAQLGILAIIGEANEGDAFSVDGVAKNIFGPDQYGEIVEKFGSGPLVDAARIALAPSNDPDITGGAQQLILLKTNASAKAQLTLPSSYGIVKAKKAGEPGNSLSTKITTSSGKRIITIENALTGEKEISNLIGGKVVFTILVTDGAVTAATMTITATNLTTTITGGTTANLNIKKSNFNTIEQLVDFINNQPGYSCVITDSTQKPMPLEVMDRVTAVDIKTSTYSLLRDAYDIKSFFDQSAFVDFTQSTFVGLPANLVKTFLTGGTLGATANADVQAALDELLKVRCNFVVPLFSRDATADITDGLTDASSAYTIDSIHAALRAHVAQASTVKGRKERQGYASYKGTFDDTKTKGANLGSARVAMDFMDIDVLGADGIITAQPYMLSVINAAMKAAAVVGLSNLNKLINISGFSHADFDPEVDGEEAILANLSYVEKAPGGGFRFAVDNSTYGQTKDAWIYNRPAVVYAADIAAYTIRLNTEQFVGKRNSDVTPETIKNLMISVMDALRASGIIVADANTQGKGFKDLVVKIEGSVVKINVTLALVENLEFILNDITVQRAQF